jgi:integrase
MASLFKRKNSPYYYIAWYDTETKKAGKPISTKCKDKREAEKFKKRWIEKKEADEKEGIIKRPLTMDTLVKLYIQDKENAGKPLKQGTIELIEKTLKRLYKVIPRELEINQYKKQHYNTFVESLKDISQNTKSIYTNKLYALFRYALKEKYIREITFGRVAEEEKEILIITDDEAKHIITKAKDSIYYDLFRFLFSSAFRVHEALKLKKEDIRDGYIYVLGKGNKMAHIPITSGIKIVLDEMNLDKYKVNDLLFPFQYDAVRMFLKRLRKNENNKEGINPIITIHDIRRYCLSRMANSGVPINFVKSFARHSNIETTLKYYVKTDMEKMEQEINSKVDFRAILQ